VKTTTSIYSCLVAALLLVLAGASIAAAQCSNTETCYGTGALNSDPSSDHQNSAFGNVALHSNTTGNGNTASGYGALYRNQTGLRDTAVGFSALGNNIAGSSNTAVGAEALYSNIGQGNPLNIGQGNTATGDGALYRNHTGNYNTAAGKQALDANTTGNHNIGVGLEAGSNLTTGDNNIDIGNKGLARESKAIRIGTQGTQTATYMAGIYEEKVGEKHCSVLVDSDGRLGCGSSKAADTSMLLNELQKQAAQMASMRASMRRQAAELKASRARELAMRTTFEERLSRLEQVMASKDANRTLAAAFNR
jgi:hypothetical protein